MGLLTKIAGPRVLGGVILASVVGLGLMWWQLQSAWGDAAQAESQAAQLRSDLESSEREITKLRAEQERREQAVTNALDARERAREEAETATQKLEKALENDQCANTRHPDAVTDSLRFGAGDADGD